MRFLIDEAAGVELRWDTGGVGAYAVRDASGALTGLRAANWDEFAQETGAYDEAAAPAYATPPDRAADNWGVDRADPRRLRAVRRDLGGGYARLPRRAHPLYLR